MASATGLWNQRENDYDAETLAALPIRRDQLADPASMDQPLRELLPEYRDMWPAFRRDPLVPGDRRRSGESHRQRLRCGRISSRSWWAPPEPCAFWFPLSPMEFRAGLWCYRLDRRRLIMGGALSNGGEVYAWLKRTLAFPKDAEARLEAAAPGGHGLTVLPFLAGERSPYWRADLRGAIAGLSLSTEPFDILHASLESVALRFREIYNLLVQRVGAPAEVIASGGALFHSPAWTQMMADTLGRAVTASTEQEALQPGRGIARAGASRRDP